MRTINKIGSLVTGAFMIGSALSGAVSAALDDTGLTSDFFYDSSFNPVVQIVVGEKGMATDAVAAGNVAAVIGNLAYSSSMTSASGSTSGQLVLGISARGATGKYLQGLTEITSGTRLVAEDGDSDSNADFYTRSDGLLFKNETVEYSYGEFVQYSLACDQQQRTAAGILKKGTFGNVHCLFCQTLCLGQLENPTHDMEEYITVDYSDMRYYEDGLSRSDAEELKLKVPSKALKYIVKLGDIPLTTIYDSTATTRNEVDFEYRGKMILFGNEYFIKDVSGTTKIYLAKGKVLDDVSSEGYTAEYLGYKFKVDHLIYSAEYQVAGILLDVERPDGTVIQVQISKMANGVVDDIEIAGVYAEEADAVATASLLIYDTTTNVVLEDGKELELGGEIKDGWKVEITDGVFDGSSTGLTASDMDVSEYDDMYGKTLNNITIEYRNSHTTTKALSVGDSIMFPTTYNFIYSGYRDVNFREVPCSGAGVGGITLTKANEFAPTLEFMDKTGQTHTSSIFESGYSEGDVFFLKGNVVEYTKYEEKIKSGTNKAEVTITNLIDGDVNTYTLNPYTSSDYQVTTYTFEESAENDEITDVIVDSNENDTSVFNGVVQGLVASTVDNVLGFAENATDVTLSVSDDMLGTFTGFDKGDTGFSLFAINEDGTDHNLDGQTDDILFVFKNDFGEYAIVDVYDRAYNSSDSAYTEYTERVTVTDQVVAAGTPLVSGNDHLVVNDDKDSTIILPRGGETITISWGARNSIQSVNICKPKDTVYQTIFVGTGEQATTMDAIITKDDEGTEKNVGCCSYLVKEFGVQATTDEVTEILINPIVGSLVVPEIQANTSKNLIIVGGPAVNGMASGLVTAAEVQSAIGQFIVKKSGKKLIIAGLSSADTIDGGTALTYWLRANIH